MPLSFRDLQRQLQPAWGQEHGTCGLDVDLLMVPSLSVDPAELDLITGAVHYEERQLFSLIRLRDPGVRMVYVTSKLLPDLVVDAVLELLPGVPTAHARRRLQLFDTDDGSSRPLTAKLLERPALLTRIAEQLRLLRGDGTREGAVGAAPGAPVRHRSGVKPLGQQGGQPGALCPLRPPPSRWKRPGAPARRPG
jgi:hypothetical protein